MHSVFSLECERFSRNWSPGIVQAQPIRCRLVELPRHGRQPRPLQPRVQPHKMAEILERPSSRAEHPCDEHPLHFDALDPKLHPEQLETLVRTTIDYGRTPRVSVSLSRQFSKALDEANKSVDVAFLCRSRLISIFMRVQMDLFPRALTMRGTPQLQPIELRISTTLDAQTPSSELCVAPLFRYVAEPPRPPCAATYSPPAPKPVPLISRMSQSARAAAYRRAHSMLRHRKGMYVTPGSITGEPSEILDNMEFQDVSLDAALDADRKTLAMDDHDVSF
ncbi:hypothetical protein B0H17DRAFT_1257750 [Mycena rosella]|uniref:Uncharacterized protein n=1 Tax=Mycena rosella TaxID=1033263 RepID=A0AAD7G6W5_MYCRO|nr:hypothetical protein B0H17DRAFT_1257750 [Mycena rosella]